MSDVIKVAGPEGDARASVLLVHGLGGNPYDTWRGGAGDWNADETFWPPWLARDCPGVAVYAIGYVVRVSPLRGTATSLSDVATNILASLTAEPALARGPLIFIGHSLGGLLIKQVLRTADSMARYDGRAANLIERVEKIAFLGTPHTGSQLATFGDRLRILVQPSSSAASLVRNDPNLRDLNIWYRDWANSRGIRHLVLIENKQAGIFGTIVQPESSDPGLANARQLVIDADFAGISKPADRANEVYVFVRDFVAQPMQWPKPMADEVVAKLLAALGPSDTARAAEAGIESRTILELARRLAPGEALDFDEAAKVLGAAVETAIEVSEKSKRANNLSDLVDTILSRIAAKTRAGDIEGAASEADQGIAAYEREEAERQAASVQSGIALQEARLQLDILRRDAQAAAQRVQRIVALQHPNDAREQFAALRERQKRFHERGGGSEYQIDYLIASEITRLSDEHSQHHKATASAPERSDQRPSKIEKVRILFVAANPPDTTRLDLYEEAREIDTKVRAAEYRDSMEIITKWAARPGDLLQYLNQYKPHVVQFSGQGSPQEEIMFVGEQGKSKPVSKEALTSLFRALNKNNNIRVVVLNACFSKPQALAITEEVDCAIGMSRAIGDAAAIIFAGQFYQAVAFGCSVKDAFDQGIAALLLNGVPENHTPILLTRAGKSAELVILVSR